MGTDWNGVSGFLNFQRLQPASKNLVSSIPTVSTILNCLREKSLWLFLLETGSRPSNYKMICFTTGVIVYY